MRYVLKLRKGNDFLKFLKFMNNKLNKSYINANFKKMEC